MNHEEWKLRLSALLDGELTGAEREETLKHLDGCEACQSYFAELNAMRDALNGMDEIEPPAGFAAGVMQRLHEGSRGNAWAAPKPKRRIPRAWAGMAACAAAVLLAVTLPRMRMGSSAPTASGSSTASSSSMYYASSAGGAAAESAPAEAAPSAAMAAPEAVEEAAVEQPPDSVSGAAAFEADSGMGSRSGATADAALPETQAAVFDAAAAETKASAELPEAALSGEGAADWLAANGWQGESGDWYADAGLLRGLPDGLTVSGEIPADYSGAVRVSIGEVTP